MLTLFLQVLPLLLLLLVRARPKPRDALPLHDLPGLHARVFIVLVAFLVCADGHCQDRLPSSALGSLAVQPARGDGRHVVLLLQAAFGIFVLSLSMVRTYLFTYASGPGVPGGPTRSTSTAS